MPDLAVVESDLVRLHDQGFRSLSIAFLHAYTYAEHELAVGRLALDVGFDHVSMSSQLSPMVRLVPRGHSAVADAYLTPELKRYLKGQVFIVARLTAGFRQALSISALACYSSCKRGMLSMAEALYAHKLTSVKWISTMG